MVGLHHFQKRKRVYQKCEPYPHPHRFKRFMDRFIYIIAVFGMVMTIPQITKIWVGKNASGVSAVSWGAYMFGAVFWLTYGLMHKDKPIIFTYSVWLALDIFVVVGTVLYG